MATKGGLEHMKSQTCNVRRMLRDASTGPDGRRRPVVGMVGGGQLARMTAGAAARLGVSLSVLDPDPGCPAAVGASVVVADVDDLTALVAFGREVDVVTFDHERIPVELVEALEAEGWRSLRVCFLPVCVRQGRLRLASTTSATPCASRS